MQGFSLIEIMITLAIMAILASIAYPSYLSQLQRGRRTDGQTALLHIALRMEHYFTENGSYAGATLSGLGLTNSSAQNFYTLTIDTDTTTTFSLKATPQGAQAGDPCGVLSLDNTNTRAAAQANCW